MRTCFFVACVSASIPILSAAYSKAIMSSAKSQFDSLTPNDIVYGIAEVVHQRITKTGGYSVEDVLSAIDFLPYEIRERLILLLLNDSEFNDIPNKYMRNLERYLERYQRKKSRYAQRRTAARTSTAASSDDDSSSDEEPVQKPKTRKTASKDTSAERDTSREQPLLQTVKDLERILNEMQ